MRFACPRCGVVLEAPESRAGDKIPCPKCQQRLQIPGPPRNKTVLAKVVPGPIVIDPNRLKPPETLPQSEPTPALAPADPATQLPLSDLPVPGASRLPLKRTLVAAVVLMGVLVAGLAFGLLTLVFPYEPWNPVGDLAHFGWTAAAHSASAGQLHEGILLVELVGDRQPLQFMRIYLLLENRSDTLKIDLASDLNMPAKGRAARSPTTWATATVAPRELLNPPSLRPKDFAIVVLTAEAPVDPARCLYLDMPSPVQNSTERLKFRMPVKRETVTRDLLVAFPDLFGYLPNRPVTRTVLFKRNDFEDWFQKYRQKNRDVFEDLMGQIQRMEFFLP